MKELSIERMEQAKGGCGIETMMLYAFSSSYYAGKDNRLAGAYMAALFACM